MDLFLSQSVMPVRMMKNKFFREVEEMELKGASREELAAHLGRYFRTREEPGSSCL
jgi:hypothetical protein